MSRRPASPSVRGEYLRLGVERFYQDHGHEYQNPHEARIGQALRAVLERHALGPNSRVLDLCCGSGEVTLALRDLGRYQVDGADPYTGAAYERRTGTRPIAIGFEQIAGGALLDRQYDLIVCSFALHLLASSRLPAVVWQLSRSAPHLWILTPHKRPHLSPHWGFALTDEVVLERVRARVYARTSGSAQDGG